MAGEVGEAEAEDEASEGVEAVEEGASDLELTQWVVVEAVEATPADGNLSPFTDLFRDSTPVYDS